MSSEVQALLAPRILSGVWPRRVPAAMPASLAWTRSGGPGRRLPTGVSDLDSGVVEYVGNADRQAS